MAIDPRLEAYLESLERALKPLPVSDRAEIVTEIKSHVLSALERNPQQPLDTVLQALGEPETVANRYLMERGNAPVKPPISPIVKWLVIGFLGTFAMLLLFAGFLVYQARNLVKVDAANERVSVLNGLIDVDGKKDQIRIGGKVVSDQEDKDDWKDGNQVSGYLAASPAIKSVLIRFSSGRLRIMAGKSRGLDWKCTGDFTNPKQPPFASGEVTLDLTSASGGKCSVGVPAGVSVRVDSQKGKVEIEASPAEGYRYSMSVGNGKADSFPQTNDPKLPLIQVNLKAGKIENEGANGAENQE